MHYKEETLSLSFRCLPMLMAGLVGLVLVGSHTFAADHRDSPQITANIGSLGNLDILNVYAFQSPQVRSPAV